MSSTAIAPENPASRKRVAFGISLALHLALLSFLLLYTIITPIPPTYEIDEEGGGGGHNDTEVALGLDLMGSGDDQGNSAPSQVQNTPPPPPEEAAPLTNDVETDNPSVSTPEKPVEKPTKPVTKPVKPTKTKEQQEEEFRNKMNNVWSNTGSGESGHGTATTPGNEGVSGGRAGATGIGNGAGVYRGPGPRIDVPGYTVKNRPVIDDKPNVGGKVYMDIVVSPDGKVLRATQNTGKSTTLNQTLVAIAKRACMATTFYPNPKATGEQQGSILFVFELQ